MSEANGEFNKLHKLKATLNKSPYWKHINMELVEFTESGCRMKMVVGNELCNLYGIAHGGSIASLADSTCGLSLLGKLNEGEIIVTQNLIVNYLIPVQKGVLTSIGWIVHRGKTSAVLEADIFNEAGEKVAHAQTIHAIRKGNIEYTE